MSVYFARAGEYLKIGYSKDPRQRIRTLRCHKDSIRPTGLDDAAPVELVAVIDGNRDTERILHRVFAGLRECGEWYRIPEPEPPFQVPPMPALADYLAGRKW